MTRYAPPEVLGIDPQRRVMLGVRRLGVLEDCGLARFALDAPTTRALAGRWPELFAALRAVGVHGLDLAPTPETLAAAAECGWVASAGLPALPALPEEPPLAMLLDAQSPPERADPSYARALTISTPTGAQVAMIAQLEATALAALERTLVAHPALGALGVRRTASIGSNTRGTAVDAAPDLDLLVETATAVADYPSAVLDPALRTVAQALAKDPGFARWCASAELDPAAAEVHLDSFGKRGAATLVARFIARDGRAARPLLDVTVTPSSRPGDYHDWMQHHLAAHAPEHAARLRAELRLAKAAFGALGTVYGSRARGLRPITVEQLVLQSPRHHPSGLAVGTFDAVMALVYAHRALPFGAYRARFPVWRPGAPGTTARDAAGQATDLLGLVADGDGPRAEEKWRRVIAFASAYAEHRTRRLDWTPRSLAASLRDL